jgi:hypothetical protein
MAGSRSRLLIGLAAQVPVGQDVALPGEVQRLGAVHVLGPLGDVQHRAAVLGGIGKARVVDGIRHVEVDAAHVVDQLDEGGVVDQSVVFDRNANVPLDGQRRGGRPAVLIGRVDPLVADPGDVHPQIAGHRQHGRLLLVGVEGEDHHGVGQVGARVVGGVLGAHDQHRDGVARPVDRWRGLVRRRCHRAQGAAQQVGRRSPDYAAAPYAHQRRRRQDGSHQPDGTPQPPGAPCPPAADGRLHPGVLGRHERATPPQARRRSRFFPASGAPSIARRRDDHTLT